MKTQFIEELEEYGSMEKYFLILPLSQYHTEGDPLYDHLTWEFYNVWEAKSILTLIHSNCPQLIVTMVIKINYLWGIVCFVGITRIFIFFPSNVRFEKDSFDGPFVSKTKSL